MEWQVQVHMVAKEEKPELLKDRIHKLQMWSAGMLDLAEGVVSARAMAWTRG